MLKKIINWFKGDLSKLELYKKLVTESRNPLYYTDYQIEDSVTGRFENIILHLFLVSHRISEDEGNDSKNIISLQEAFIMDMDRNLREMGVGDMSVGKKVKEMAAGWYGTAKVYEEALLCDNREEDLQKALFENVYRQKEGAPVEEFTAHIITVYDHLKTVSLDDLYACSFTYPEVPAVKN